MNYYYQGNLLFSLNFKIQGDILHNFNICVLDPEKNLPDHGIAE